MAVSGPISPSSLRSWTPTTTWIGAVEASHRQPALTEYDAILSELKEYVEVEARQSWIASRRLRQKRNQDAPASRESGVTVIAATGFHRRSYYPGSWWMWTLSQAIARYFVDEARRVAGDARATGAGEAGFINVPVSRRWRRPRRAEAAAWAAPSWDSASSAH
jgi:hypothetical protein